MAQYGRGRHCQKEEQVFVSCSSSKKLKIKQTYHMYMYSEHVRVHVQVILMDYGSSFKYLKGETYMYKMHVHVHVVRNNDPPTPNLSQHY